MSLIGRPYSFTANGRDWTLARFTYTHWEELVEMAKAIIPDPRKEVAEFLKVAPETPLEEKRKMVYDANNKYVRMFEVGSDEMAEWFQTPKGVVRWLYVMLKTNHPDITLNDAFDIVRSGELDVNAAVQAVSGAQPEKKSSPGDGS